MVSHQTHGQLQIPYFGTFLWAFSLQQRFLFFASANPRVTRSWPIYINHNIYIYIRMAAQASLVLASAQFAIQRVSTFRHVHVAYTFHRLRFRQRKFCHILEYKRFHDKFGISELSWQSLRQQPRLTLYTFLHYSAFCLINLTQVFLDTIATVGYTVI